MMRKILTFFAALLIAGLLLMSYNAGKAQGIRHAIMTASPFIVEIPNADNDTFQVFVDYDGDIHEYAGTIC